MISQGERGASALESMASCVKSCGTRTQCLTLDGHGKWGNTANYLGLKGGNRARGCYFAGDRFVGGRLSVCAGACRDWLS